MRKNKKKVYKSICFSEFEKKKCINLINKTLAIFTVLFVMMSYCVTVYAINQDNNLGVTDEINLEDEDVNIEEIQKEVLETSADTEEVSVDSRIALIYDRASGRILYEKNGNKQTPMASTTKIMTAIVVLENANLTDVVTIDFKAAGIGGSRLGLKKNDKISVNDLLYGLMLRSRK